MKKVLILSVCLLSLCSFSQYYNVLELRNGSLIRGKVVEANDAYTKIKTKDGSVWVFDEDEILSIEKYLPKVSGKGVFMRAEVGIAGGTEVSPSFHVVNGYSFNPHLDVGLGTGIESFWGRSYLPAFVNGRYDLLNRHWTPYVDVMAGYDFPLSRWEINKGGFTSAIRLGFTKYVSNRIGLSTSVGYRFAHLREVDNWWDDFITIRQINRLELRFAITFK